MYLFISPSVSQTDMMHQNVFELIHTEDQQAFRHNLHWALNPPPTSTQTEESPQGQEMYNFISWYHYIGLFLPEIKQKSVYLLNNHVVVLMFWYTD